MRVSNLINAALKPLGYQVRKCKSNPRLRAGRREYEFLDGVLEVSIERLGSLNIVQVGANDGKHEDPIFQFAARNPSTTKLLLIEPQPELAEQLALNYAFHPGATVSQSAISTAQDIILYRIAPSYWDKSRTSKGRPPHVKASGITSLSRDHVVNRAKRYLPDYRNRVDEVIEEIRLKACSLQTVLSQSGFGDEIDVLQVDAEGFDDDVIYASDISEFRPKLINFEVEHLTDKRREDLLNFLISEGYRVLRYKQSDSIAFRSGALK